MIISLQCRQCNTDEPNQEIMTTNDGERNIMVLKFDSKLSRDVRSSQNHKFTLRVEAVGGKLVLSQLLKNKVFLERNIWKKTKLFCFIWNQEA